MKKLFIFFGIVIIIILILNLALFIFINAKGKDFVAESIRDNLGVEASMDSLAFKFPFSIEIKNFKCDNISFKKADILLGMPNPFRSKIVLNRVAIDGLNIKIIKNDEGITFLPSPSENHPAAQKKVEEEAPESQTAKAEEKREFDIKLRFGYIKNGVVEFIDLTGEKPLMVAFENVDLKLRNFSYPKLTKFHVTMDSALKTDKRLLEDAVSIDGWVDYFHKNMDADLNLNSIDYTSFSQHYPPFWKPDNLGIEEAYLSLKAEFNSKNNDLIIDSVLSLDTIEFREDIEDPSNRDLIRTVIELLKSDKEKASLNLKFKTKMDSPNLDLSSIKNSLPLPSFLITKSVIGKTKKAASKGIKDVKGIAIDKPLDTIKGTLGIIQDIISPSDANTE